MIYLLETYEGHNTIQQCLVHCPLDEFQALFNHCHERFGAFRLTKFAEYSFGCGGIPFYDDAKNFTNMESKGIAPRPGRGPFTDFNGSATVRNLK